MSQRFDPEGAPHPAVLAYDENVQHRAKSLGTAGAGPPIPRLDGQARPGLTMADQAALHERRESLPPFFQEGAPAMPARGRPALLPQDLLPDAALRDPDFRESPGARYAASQPDLARKYGVLRNGRFVSPTELETGKPGLKPETIHDITTIQQLQNAPAQEPKAKEGEARTAAPNSPDTEASETSDPERARRILSELDDFDLNALREVLREDCLNNQGQRRLIESRLVPLKLRDLLMRGYVTQTIPIVPGEFEYELQSTTADDDLELKRILATAHPHIDPNSRYFIDRFSLMNAVVGVRAINKIPLPDHRDKDGNFDEALFWEKLKRVKRHSFHVVSSIWIHCQWFDQRVREMCTATALGNGS